MSDPTKFCRRCKAEYDPELPHTCRLSHVLEPSLEGETRSDAERHEAARLSRISEQAQSGGLRTGWGFNGVANP